MDFARVVGKRGGHLPARGVRRRQCLLFRHATRADALPMQSCASSHGQHLVKEVHHHRGAREVELAGDECADGHDIDVDTLGGVVEGTWAELEVQVDDRPTATVGRLGAGQRRMSGVSRPDPRTCAGRSGESIVLDEGRPKVGQVRDQGCNRVAVPLDSPLVLQDAALTCACLRQRWSAPMMGELVITLLMTVLELQALR